LIPETFSPGAVCGHAGEPSGAAPAVPPVPTGDASELEVDPPRASVPPWLPKLEPHPIARATSDTAAPMDNRSETTSLHLLMFGDPVA